MAKRQDFVSKLAKGQKKGEACPTCGSVFSFLKKVESYFSDDTQTWKYRAANLKKIGYSHIVHSYVLASLSSILNGKVKKALEIISEIDSEGKTVVSFKEMIKMIIDWVSKGKRVEINSFPYRIRRIIEGSEEIMYIISLFKNFQPPPQFLS